MKKIVSADRPDLHPFFESMDLQLYRCGYEIVSVENNVPVIRAIENATMMPKMEMTVEEEGGKLYFYPKLTFPVLDGIKLQYFDSIHYWLGNWEKVGRVCTEIERHAFDPSMYEEDEDEEE